MNKKDNFLLTVFYFIRSLVHLLWSIFWLITVPFAMIIIKPFVRREQMYKPARFFLAMSSYGLRYICGVKWRITGMENLPQTPHREGEIPLVLLVKHQSAIETFLMPVIMPRPLAYVFKRELLKIPLFGWGIGQTEMIHINRKEGKRAFSEVVDQGKRLLSKGIWVMMFPEGTRIPRGEVGDYKTGGTRLAIEVGASVVPIAVTTAKCLPRKTFIKRPGTVDISIGKPIASTGRNAHDLLEEVKTWIETEMHRLDPQAYNTPAPDANGLPPTEIISSTFSETTQILQTNTPPHQS